MRRGVFSEELNRSEAKLRPLSPIMLFDYCDDIHLADTSSKLYGRPGHYRRNDA